MAQRVALRRQDSARTREARRKLPLVDLYPPNMVPAAVIDKQLLSKRRYDARAADSEIMREERRQQEEARDEERQRAATEHAIAHRKEVAERAKVDIAAAAEAKAAAETKAAEELRAMQKANAAAESKLYAEADADGDGKLDLAEFCTLVRSRGDGADATDAQLEERFRKLDGDGSGQIEMAEYRRMVKVEAEEAKAKALARFFGKERMQGLTLEGALQATELHWGDKGLDKEDAPVLAYLLFTHKTLTSLDVSFNDMGDAVCYAPVLSPPTHTARGPHTAQHMPLPISIHPFRLCDLGSAP